MRIAHVITLADRGGAQAHALQLMRGLPGEPALICGEEGWLTEAAQAAGVPVHLAPALQRAPGLTDLRALGQLRAILQRVQPDVAHLHGFKAGLLGRLAARSLALPSVYTAHGLNTDLGYPLSRRLLALPLEALAARLSGANIAVSAHEADLFAKLRAPRVHHVPNAIADHPARAQPDRQPPRAVMVARFQEPKDHATLLRAVARLPQPLELDLVGDGPRLPAIRRLAAELGLGQVRFLGERDDVPTLLARAQIAVLASRKEGLPLAILEAMRAGLPVVASRVGGVPELIEHGVSGSLVPPSDPEPLAHALARLIEAPALRARLGAGARARFVAHHSEAAMLDAVWRSYGVAKRRSGHRDDGTPTIQV